MRLPPVLMAEDSTGLNSLPAAGELNWLEQVQAFLCDTEDPSRPTQDISVCLFVHKSMQGMSTYKQALL